MRAFIDSLAVAASSKYALVAYAICGALFVLVGAKLSMVRSVLRQIRDVPEGERRHVIETVTNSILPASITADEWIRNNRNRWVYLLCAAIVLCAAAIIAIALFAPGLPREPSPTVEQGRLVAEALLAEIDEEHYDSAYESFYPGWKVKMEKSQWMQLSNTVRKPLGTVETRQYVGASNTAPFTMDQPLHGIQLLYHTKFSNLAQPVREAVGLASPGMPEDWRAVGYLIDVPPSFVPAPDHSVVPSPIGLSATSATPAD